MQGLMLFANELHRRYHKQGLVSVSLHPGMNVPSMCPRFQLKLHLGLIKTNCYKYKSAWLMFIPVSSQGKLWYYTLNSRSIFLCIQHLWVP
jgi:hypothetical protein